MNVFDFHAKDLGGERVDLARFRGQVLLIVNTASACGFTPQYAQLQALHERHHARGLAVLGFPCNQFGHQEPGTETEIGAFCTREFGVSFPLFSKIEVNGLDADPLFRFLKQTAPGVLGTQAIKWNFTKFLVDRSGTQVKRYAPATSPAALEKDIEQLLAAQG